MHPAPPGRGGPGTRGAGATWAAHECRTGAPPAPPGRAWHPWHPALVLLLLVAGCAASGGGKAPPGRFGRLSDKDADDLFLKGAVGLLIHEALTEGNPEALRRFFPPDVRSSVDCAAFYRRVMGAAPGVYQPRFWDTKLLEIRYLEGRQQAQTRLTVECTDVRRGAGGGGKFIPLELDWVRQGGGWFLAPSAR